MTVPFRNSLFIASGPCPVPLTVTCLQSLRVSMGLLTRRPTPQARALATRYLALTARLEAGTPWHTLQAADLELLRGSLTSSLLLSETRPDPELDAAALDATLTHVQAALHRGADALSA